MAKRIDSHQIMIPKTTQKTDLKIVCCLWVSWIFVRVNYPCLFIFISKHHMMSKVRFFAQEEHMYYKSSLFFLQPFCALDLKCVYPIFFSSSSSSSPSWFSFSMKKFHGSAYREDFVSRMLQAL